MTWQLGRVGSPGGADWGTFRPDVDGVCLVCGRTIAWHAGYGCFAPDARGLPAPLPRDVQLELDVAAA